MPAPSAVGAPPAVPADFTISLERRRCFGICPADLITIDAAGNLRFVGDYPDRGCASRTITREEVTALAARVDAMGYFALQDSYTDDVTDHPWAITRVTSAGRQKTIAHYLADPLGAPDLADRQALSDLEHAIDVAAGVPRAPLTTCP
jgi:hypothetical protein